jgi:DNA polymerase, archaea type
MTDVITQETIENFLNGEDPEKYITSLEFDYKNNCIYKIIQDPVEGKIIKKDSFTAFLWCSDFSQLNFYKGDKNLQRKKMQEHGINIRKLNTYDNERLENGLKYLIISTKGYSNLIDFFKYGGIDPWGDKTKQFFQVLSPVEQYLIQKKKRLFKGLEEYEDIHRLVFDIETEGLDPEKCKIILIGIKDNRGFKRVIPAFGQDGEMKCIIEFFYWLGNIKPSIIAGYNSASFDFPFILRRAEILGMDVNVLTKILSQVPIKKKNGVLKLASEVENFNQYLLWGFNVVDISHSVRRAQAMNSEIKSWGLKYVTQYLDKAKPNRVYVDGSLISKIYLENKNYYMNPKTGQYREIGTPGTENIMERFPGKYEIWTGQQIIEQYLDDDLYETMVVDESFGLSTFLLSKLMPTSFERISTMGTATLWKMIMLEWSYQHNLAIPEKDQKRAITGGLSRLVNTGFAKNIVKFDFRSLYPSIDLLFGLFPKCDVTGALRYMLKYFRDTRIKYKELAGELKDTNKVLSEMYDRKQLPIKIFINAFFGSLSAPHVFPWAEMNLGEMTTCIGRQSLRMMLMFYIKRGYKPLVMDTDGVNFEIPDDINTHKYIGKGLCDLSIKDKEYVGVAADTAEFNDIFMRDEMGLDIDYEAPSCINLSRKNYIIKTVKNNKTKIKLTGNSIKSKKIPQYISEFFDESLKYLLDDDGHTFLKLYYDYVDKIFNKKIPLLKIANRAKVKMTNDEYIKHIKKTTKSGGAMARQAHMELIIKNNYLANMGETIFYVNNGIKVTDGDVERVMKWEISGMKKKERDAWEKLNGRTMKKVLDKITLNAYMLDSKELEENPDKMGEYNVNRYLAAFNKKVEPLLVAFNPEIRDDILVNNPKDKGIFTIEQCKLVNGFPIDPSKQDNLDEVLTLSDSEVLFWNKMGLDPFMMYIDNTLELVDQHYIEKNRKVLSLQLEASQNNEDEELIENDDHDYAVHTVLYK